MEQLKIEKMRKFYDTFPYPNRPIFQSPVLLMQLIAHGGFGQAILEENIPLSKEIKCIYENYSEVTWFKRNQMLKYYMRFLKTKFSEEKRILLVGCGTDEPLLFRKLHLENEIIGIDLSKKAIRKAKAKLSFHSYIHRIFSLQKLKKVELLVGNAEMVLKEKALGDFDYIQCFGVLHHQPEPYYLLKSMVDRLNKNALLRLMVYSYHGRKLERRIQKRYAGIWDLFLQRRIFKAKLFTHFFKLRFWQTLNFFGLFSSTFYRFRYLGFGSACVADAFLHPSDPGIPLGDIYDMASSLGLKLIYCEGKLESEGYLLGFDNPDEVWKKIVEADAKQDLLSNPILIFCKV
ncbi:class I SAM-dependent methyltransferase [Pigmentibacter sp. JX0631]|uniref:class I SAM-dependent methyltransferase n=1 Tax=Pigmentibacter sp. JX0631 TaxID=2976982 RepID=UPI002468C2F4|nr:class I SAM-dependent methyltransferase [Pigmentibacter sp. JX0631]WGL61353.1 class I SAM-dependent methyltransferase [Pigmentibacter sp. JX0631]